MSCFPHRRIRTTAAALILAAASGLAAGAPVEATTAGGDKVLLHPNGRWEYVDQKKAEQARAVAQQFPENQGCPPGSQGGLFGIGRCIMPGDKDFNRGSLNPNRR
jgi:hypothetical protein